MMKRQHERGVALLLALGILSLLLVMGIAFVTNALLAQKSAAAYRFRSQSQLLGKSAVNRVMMLMRYYLDQGDDEGIGDLYSSSNGTVNGQAGDIPAAAENDQLTPAADSLLTARVDNVVRNAPTTPRWEYLWDDYNNGVRTADAKLVGRFAYWILPGGTVNFSEILRGNPALTPARSMSTWTRRRGFGIRELNLDGNPYLATAQLNTLDNRFSGEAGIVDNDPRQQDSSRAVDYPTFLAMFNACPALTLTERNVIRRFLPPGGTEEEVYFSVSGTYSKDTFNPNRASNLTMYHRFDLTRTNWDSLGNSAAIPNSIPNSDDLVKRLLGIDVTPAERAAGDTSIDESTEAWSDCIPALRRVHAAKDYYPSLETRRKQVAANLIDYCDADSEPTSDSTDWETTAPAYTGNEKTPYINEIMVSPSVSITRTETESTSGGVPSYTYTYSADIGLRLLALETVNLYDGTFPQMDAAVTGEYTVEITADSNPLQTVKVTFEIPLAGKDTWLVDNRYAHKVLYVDGNPVTAVINQDATLKWEDYTTASSGTQLTDPLQIKVKVTNIKITKIHLKCEDKNADFVRDLEAEPVLENTVTALTAATPACTVTAYPHIGFEVADPRENLYQGNKTDETLMNWRLMEVAHAVTTSATTEPKDITEKFTMAVPAAQNHFCDPANDPATAKDQEASNLIDLSSAYIANAPMKTLVELGAIHRAAKWQTLNLRASRCTPATPVLHGIDAAGDTYQQGDAWILDQVKLTPHVQVPHRLYINVPPGSNTPESALLYTGIFRGLVWNWDKHYNYEYGGTPITVAAAVTAGNVLAGRDVSINNGQNKFFSRAELINFASGANTLSNAYGQIAPTTDAQSETVPALVSGLISFFPRSPDPVTMILAAQSIRDVGTTAGFTMSKLRNDGSGNSENTTVHSGRFDFVNNVYFDEITGTSRFYVEIGIDSDNTRVNLLRLEPLD